MCDGGHRLFEKTNLGILKAGKVLSWAYVGVRSLPFDVKGKCTSTLILYLEVDKTRAVVQLACYGRSPLGHYRSAEHDISACMSLLQLRSSQN